MPDPWTRTYLCCILYVEFPVAAATVRDHDAANSAKACGVTLIISDMTLILIVVGRALGSLPVNILNPGNAPEGRVAKMSFQKTVPW